MDNWSSIDGVFCISLIGRADRRALLSEQFSRLQLDVEYVLVEPDSADPQRGCFASHQRCAEMIVQRGWRRALILEDDVLFHHVTPGQVKRVNRYLERFDPPVFYLGLILGKLWPTWQRGIVACRAQGTHAYILGGDAALSVVSLQYENQGIDTVLKRRFPGRAVYPMFCQQQPESVGKSDLDCGREPGFVKDELFWRKNHAKQYVEWRKNFFMLLMPGRRS